MAEPLIQYWPSYSFSISSWHWKNMSSHERRCIV